MRLYFYILASDVGYARCPKWTVACGESIKVACLVYSGQTICADAGADPGGIGYICAGQGAVDTLRGMVPVVPASRLLV
jgi:hypothetical protein